MENKNMKRITNITYPAFALLALACFALSPTAQAKPQPTPTPTPAPPGGVREFTASSTFVVPDGVYKLLVELWGAGGGAGGCLNQPAQSEEPGGLGSAGAYTRGVLNVVPGTTVTVIVGIGGSGAQCNFNGGDGGSSSVSNGSSSITSGGGHGGAVGNYLGPGADGAPATPDPNWFGRASAESQSWSPDRGWFWVPNIGLPFVGTVEPRGAFGGIIYSSMNNGRPGGPGADGYVFITY
jgi:hypothetical protein